MKYYKFNIMIFFLILSTILFGQISSSLCFELSSATVCEVISGGKPKYDAVVFSSSVKKIYCYTLFNDVKNEGFIYHAWFFRDKLISKVKLKVKPPIWATFSRIYIRESDIGPWRVDILDETGKIIDVIRFSVVE